MISSNKKDKHEEHKLPIRSNSFAKHIDLQLLGRSERCERRSSSETVAKVLNQKSTDCDQGIGHGLSI